MTRLDPTAVRKDGMPTIPNRGRSWLLAAGVLSFASLCLYGGACWYLADLTRDSALVPNHGPDEMNLIVQALDDSQIRLQALAPNEVPAYWRYEGVYGVESAHGYAQVGPIVEQGADYVVRKFQGLQQGQMAVGDAVGMDSFAFAGDPQSVRNIPFEHRTYTSAGGEFPAWYVDGPASRWIIFVHGQNSTMEESLRTLPLWYELGYPALAISYRNDAGVPRNDDGYMWHGLTEWQDLEGAVQYALAQGAEDVVLVGYSMGGGIVVNFLYESALAGKVRGAILNSPMLSLEAVFDRAAQRMGIPAFLGKGVKTLAHWRFGLSWSRLNYLSRAQMLQTPILLFHGVPDPTVPVTTSDALAASRPDLVQYERSDQAGHVRQWNLDAQQYEARLREFLQTLDNPA